MTYFAGSGWLFISRLTPLALLSAVAAAPGAPAVTGGGWSDDAGDVVDVVTPLVAAVVVTVALVGADVVLEAAWGIGGRGPLWAAVGLVELPDNKYKNKLLT